MAIIVDVPGVGPTEFPDEQSATAYFQKNNAPKEKSFLESILGGPIETSPLSGEDRFKTSWGNKEGVVDYLKGQGRDAVYRGEDLYVDGQKADPGGEFDLAALTGPGMMAAAPYHIYQALKGMADGKAPDNFRNAASGVADMGNDFNEGMPSFLESALTGAAASVPYFGVPFSAAAGFASEKLKEGVGNLLGTYKTNGDFFTPEANKTALMSGVSAAIPKAISAADAGIGAASRYLKNDVKVPGRIYAAGMNMGEEFAKDPESVNFLLKNGIKGWTRAGIKEKALAAGKAEQEILENELKKIPDITDDQIKSLVGKYLSNPGGGNFDSYDKALTETADEIFNNYNGKFYNRNIWKDRVTESVDDAAVPPSVPDDAVLEHAYEKQYPKDYVNLPMRKYTETKTVDTKRPSFEDFKKQLLSEMGFSEDDAAKFTAPVYAKNADGEDVPESVLRKMYEDKYPATKDVKRTYPLPEGKMIPPSFEEWKDDFVSRYMKQNTPSGVKKSTEKVASAVDLNKDKRGLQHAAENLFGSDSYNISKKDAQRAWSSAIREAIENASGDPDKIAGINKSIKNYYSVFGGLEDQEAKELSKPFLTGTDAILAGVSGPAAVAKKAAAGVPMWAGPASQTASFLDKILTKGSSKDWMDKATQAQFAAALEALAQQGFGSTK